MKIGLFTHEFPPLTGGVGRYSYELACAAVKRGHQVTVIGPDAGAPPKEALGSFRFLPFPARRFNKWTFPQIIQLSRNTALRERFDCIHAADWPFLLSFAFLQRHTGRYPFLATAYGTEILFLSNRTFLKMLGLGRPFSIPKQIFSISHYTKNLLMHYDPFIPPERLHVTHLGVNEEWFQPVQVPVNIRRELGLPDSSKIIITVARLDSRKGHMHLMRAIHNLPQHLRTDMVYLIVGDGTGPYVEELHAAAARQSFRVIFAGRKPDAWLKNAYCQADLFCMIGQPNEKKVEGFGLVYLEAGAQGLPSVASRLGGAPEVVPEESGGYLVDPQNLQELTDAISHYFSPQGERQKRSEMARRWAQRFRWDECAKQTYENN